MDTLTRIKEAKALLVELEAQYEQEQKAMPWKPKECDLGWFVYDDGRYERAYDTYQKAFSQGHIFRTEAEAKATVELRAVVHELKQCEGFRPFVCGKDNYGFDLLLLKIRKIDAQSVTFSWQGCYFETAEQCASAIAKVGEERISKAMLYSECGVV